MRRFANVVVFLALAFVFASARPVAAQLATGSISGVVVDETKAAVADAKVTAKNLSTGATSVGQTNQFGIFKLSFLAAGQYDVTIAKDGFRTYEAEHISAQVNTDSALGTVTLPIGSTATSVEVTAAPPLLESTQAQITNTFTSQVLQTFPGIVENQGMDFLALQVPGVVGARDLTSVVNYAGVSFSVDGLRGHNNDQQIDGQNNNDNSITGPGLFLENIDFISEYQIVSGNFGAEYGRNSGSVVNIITKSGTNNFHGAVSAGETNSILETLTNQQKAFQDLTKVPRFNEIFPSASIGGPIWKDHVFFFGGFDAEINSSNAEYASGNLTPTPTGVSQLAGCWPGSTSMQMLQAYGPFGIKGGNPEILPGSTTTVDYPGAIVPNDGGTGCNVQLGGLQRLLDNSYHEYDWIYKIDVVLSNSDRFFGRYIFSKSTSFNTSNGYAAAGYPTNNPALAQAFLLDWTHTLTPNSVNDFRISYGRENTEFGGNTIGNTVPDQSQIGTAFPDIRFSNTSLMNFGAEGGFPQGRIVNTYQLQDNFSFMVGRHEFRAGANFTYQRSPNVYLPYYNGFYLFANWGAFAANTPTFVGITQGNPDMDFREHDTFLYFGDDWKIRDNLTLNLGLTWSYDGQPFNLLHNLTVQQQTGPHPFWNPTLPLSDTTLPSVPSIKHLFGPSAGFAWVPRSRWLLGSDGKTVIRGGYRLAFDAPYYNLYLEFPIFGPLSLSQTVLSSPAKPAPGLPAVPTGVNVRNSLASYLTSGVSDPRSSTEVSLSNNFGPDYVSSWSFGIQRQIVPAAVFEIRYVGNHGGGLLQSINENPYIAGLAAVYPNLLPAGITPCPSGNVAPVGASSPATGRGNCNQGKVWQFTNTGYSDYEALQTELRTSSLFRQLTLQTAYTFSKTTDNVTDPVLSSFAAGSSLAFAQNPLNYTTGEHALSGLDFPNTWTVSFLEQLPFMRSERGALGKVLGGWAVSGSYVIASGQPYTPLQEFLNTFTGGVANDYQFNSSLLGIYDTSRPFWGNPTAPANAVGIYAGDACAYTGVGCSAPPTELLSYNAINATGAVTPVSKSQVRYIANGGTADSIFDSPFGNVPRNAARDYWTNVGNFSLYKSVALGERAILQWHMTMLNVFNHPNFGGTAPGIDANIEDAGLQSEGLGFGTPQLENGGYRQIFFGVKVLF